MFRLLFNSPASPKTEAAERRLFLYRCAIRPPADEPSRCPSDAIALCAHRAPTARPLCAHPSPRKLRYAPTRNCGTAYKIRPFEQP
jgi:hypothetical protein